MKKITLLSLLVSSIVMAGGYKIPEVSLNGVALSSANIAHNKSADAAYYNPANMVFMADENSAEVDLTYIGLDAVNYSGTVSLAGTNLGTHTIASEAETFLVPSIHYVSGKNNEARFGLSIVSPGGLSKRWSNSVATYSAEEFTLKTIEINPTVALPIGDNAGFAIGLRAIYSEGIVKSTSPMASRDMTGSSLDFGYNIALAYKPTSDLELGASYRSQVDLSVEGDASLSYYDATNAFGAYTGASAATLYTSNNTANVAVPIPAVLSVAAAYTLPSKTTVEFVYERSFWSAYKDLDFNYGSSVNFVTNYVFGAVVDKSWSDTNSYRLGLTQDLDALTLMAGIVYDETPIPEKSFSFELPDTNSLSLSFGGRYQINDKLDIGLAALYSMREARSVTNTSMTGKFADAKIVLVSAGVGYKF